MTDVEVVHEGSACPARSQRPRGRYSSGINLAHEFATMCHVLQDPKTGKEVSRSPHLMVCEACGLTIKLTEE